MPVVFMGMRAVALHRNALAKELLVEQAQVVFLVPILTRCQRLLRATTEVALLVAQVQVVFLAQHHRVLLLTVTILRILRMVMQVVSVDQAQMVHR